jgi:hypothetical protein
LPIAHVCISVSGKKRLVRFRGRAPHAAQRAAHAHTWDVCGAACGFHPKAARQGAPRPGCVGGWVVGWAGLGGVRIAFAKQLGRRAARAHSHSTYTGNQPHERTGSADQRTSGGWRSHRGAEARRARATRGANDPPQRATGVKHAPTTPTNADAPPCGARQLSHELHCPAPAHENTTTCVRQVIPIAFEQKERDYLLWGCFRSSSASASAFEHTCWLLIATASTWPG